MHTLYWLGNLKGRGHLEDLGADGKVILDWILGMYGEEVWTGCIWLSIRTAGLLL